MRRLQGLLAAAGQPRRSRLAHRAATLEAMEEGGNETADLAAHVAHRMVQHHLETMDRIGARYDINQNWLLKAEWHTIYGAALNMDLVNSDGLDDDWSYFIVKTSFNF